MLSTNLKRPARGGAQDLFYSQANTKGIPTITRGDGVYIFDDKGNRFLDVISGAMAASLGQGNERVLKAMYDQGMKHTFSYVRVSRHLPNAVLTEKVAALAGPG